MSKELVEAARMGNLVKVNELLQEQSIDATYDDNEAFKTAAYEGHLPIVKRLLEIPSVRDDIRANNGAVRLAALGGHADVVELLLQTHVSLEALTKRNAQVGLWYAAAKGRLDAVEQLLRLKIVKDQAYRMFLEERVYFPPGVDLLDSLSSKRPGLLSGISILPMSAISIAAYCGHIDVVLELLQLDSIKAHIDDQDHHALRVAAMNDQEAVVYVLYKAYKSLEKTLPTDVTVSGKPLIDFVKSYEAKLAGAEEVVRDELPPKEIIGIIEEYASLLDSDKLSERRAAQKKADKYSESNKESDVAVEKTGKAPSQPKSETSLELSMPPPAAEQTLHTTTRPIVPDSHSSSQGQTSPEEVKVRGEQQQGSKATGQPKPLLPLKERWLARVETETKAARESETTKKSRPDKDGRK